MDWTTRIGESTLKTAEKLAQGFHAIPNPPKPDATKSVNHGIEFLRRLPSMHRLCNVVGMVSAYATTQYLANIIFACKINGSKCEEIPKESVPAPLRFMHGIVKYNPFSDEPRDQWLKVVHQMLPAVGGAIGAVKGSDAFFTHLNGREHKYNAWKAKDTLTPVEAEAAISYAQGKRLSMLTALTAIWASASGLTPLYGVFLNSNFMTRSGGKVATSKTLRTLTGNPSEFGLGPERGIPALLKGVENVLNGGNLDDFAKHLVEAGIEPLKKFKPGEKEALVNELKEAFTYNERAFDDLKHPTKVEVERLRRQLGQKVNEMTMRTELGELSLDNPNGVIGAVANMWPGTKEEIKHLKGLVGNTQGGGMQRS